MNKNGASLTMSIKALKWAFDVQDLTITQKCVLIALADHCSDDGVCFPGMNHLMRKTCGSKRTIQTAIRQLSDLGFLDSEVRYDENGRQRSNFYYLNVGKNIDNNVDKGRVQELHPSSKYIPEGAVAAGGRVQELHPNPNIEPSKEPTIHSQLEEVFKFWAVTTKKTGKVIFNNKRKRLLKDRLREGYSIDDCKLAITGIMKSKYNIGVNDNGVVYTNFDLIFRNGDQLEKYRSYNDASPAASQSSYATTCAQCKRKSAVLTGRPARCPECYSIYQRQSEIRAVAEFNKKSSVVEKTEQKAVSSGPPPELRDLMKKLGCKTAS